MLWVPVGDVFAAVWVFVSFGFGLALWVDLRVRFG